MKVRLDRCSASQSPPARAWGPAPLLAACTLAAVLALSTLEARGQGLGASSRALYIDVGGNTLGSSIGHEWTATPRGWGNGRVHLRAGLGVSIVNLEYRRDGTNLALPVTLTYGRSAFEVGVGVTLSTMDRNAVMPHADVGLRLASQRVAFRLSLAVMLMTSSITERCGNYDTGCVAKPYFFPGVSVGYGY